MRVLFAVLLVLLFHHSSGSAQVLVDPNDPRIQFDSKNHDVAKIPGIVTIINDMQKTIDVQLGDLDRNMNDLANLQGQLRGLSLSAKTETAFPPTVVDAFRKATNDDERIKAIRENRAALDKLLPALRNFDSEYSRLKQLFPVARRTSSTGSPFLTDVLTRFNRQIDDQVQQCNLADILKVIDKKLDDADSFADVTFSDKADLVSNIQQCVEAKRPDLNQVRSSILTDLDAQVTELKLKADRLRATRNTLFETKNKWDNQLRRATEISNSLIDWTIPLLALSVVLMLAIPRLYTFEVQQLVLSNGIILEVFTVFLLITTVLLLGIADRIQSEALGTLLGGISGYVLGRSALRTKNEPESTQDRLPRQERPAQQQTRDASLQATERQSVP